METKLTEKIINEALNTLQCFPPTSRFLGLIILLIIVWLLGSAMGPFLWNLILPKRRSKDSTKDILINRYYDVILSFGVLARDIAHGVYALRRDINSRTFKLARRALLVALTRFLGKKGNDNVRVCIFIPKNDNLVIEDAEGFSAEACEHLSLPIKETIAGEAYEKLETRYCEDRSKDRGYKEHPKRKRDYRSILCIPINSGYDVYGVLNIDAIPPKAFSEEEIKILESFAKLLAITYAIEEERRSINEREGRAETQNSAK